MTAHGTAEIWFDATALRPAEVSAHREALATVLHSAVTGVLLGTGPADAHTVPPRVRRAWLVDDDEGLARVGAGDVAVTGDARVAAQARARGLAVGERARVHDQSSLHAVCERLGEADYAFVDFADATNIPLELILARCQATRTKVIKRAATVDDALVSLGVLEHGCHGVVFTATEVGAAARFVAGAQRPPAGTVTLMEADVARVVHLGLGYRACVDTASVLGPDEGMLVGSTSSGALFACAEAHELPYMNTRPFRVNAGAVHSYIWGPDGMAEYLSDLRAGSEVLVVNTAGVTRRVAVGRVKIEVRPLALVEAHAGGMSVNLIAQDDWHVRVFGADGAVRNLTTLTPGDKVLAYVCEPGRHVGIKVDETILER